MPSLDIPRAQTWPAWRQLGLLAGRWRSRADRHASRAGSADPCANHGSTMAAIQADRAADDMRRLALDLLTYGSAR
jgi:hypothetical protein